LKVVITGASGFIGSEMLKELVRQNDYDVIPVSRQSLDFQGAILTYDFSNLPEADVLIHCGEPSVASSVGKKEFVENIYRATCILKKKYSKIIYLSSSVVYGDRYHFNVNEDCPVNINSCYVKSKIEVEKIVIENSGIVLRLANVYGRKIKKDSLFENIFDQLKKPESVIYLKNVTSERDYIFIDDVVSCVIGVIKGQVRKGIYNVGTGDSFSVSKVVNLFCQSLEREMPIVTETVPLDFRSILVLNVEKIKSSIDWIPSVNLEEGINILVKGYKN